MADYAHRNVTCCRINCNEHYLPDSWKITFPEGSIYGPFAGESWIKTHRLLFVEGPLPAFPNYCHWEAFVGSFQALHLYKYFGDTNQLSTVWDVLLRNGGDELLFRRSLVGNHNCTDTNAPFFSTNPPGEDWTSMSEVPFEPWRYADGP